MNSECKKLKLIIVNLITSIRLIGAISLPVFYFTKGIGFFSILTIILFSTDYIDGFLARKWKVSTFFGSAMDASCDKLLNVSSFILLSLTYNELIIPLIIEIAIAYTSYSTYRYGGNVQSTKIGKIKTFIADTCIILCFLILSLPLFNLSNSFVNYIINNNELILMILIYIITLSGFVALFDYMRINKTARLNPKAVEIKVKKKKLKSMKWIIKDLFDTNYYLNHKNESLIKQLYK